MRRIFSQLQHRFYVAALLVFVLFAFADCGKRNKIEWIYYDETRCADQWEFNINNEKLKENIISTMEARGVDIIELEIFSDRTPSGCFECDCKTGRRIKAKIRGKDLSAAQSQGFYQ